MDTTIDPKRIEAALREHPQLSDALVVAAGDGDGNGEGRPELVAYVVPRRGVGEVSSGGELKFSLFYFADAAKGPDDDNYRLYLEGARFADENGFEAVWTPERHFHANGGLYPNPSVLSAALAIATRRVKLRAGSVALPLHYPLRVAEEWSVVDNLSNGRVGLSFTSGWVPNDFSIAPAPEESFKAKREVMLRNLEQVRRLWEGGTILTRDGVGNEVELEIFPKPVQPTLPVWMTCSGDPVMFEKAGEAGFNVLTALLTQSLEETAGKIALYRKARAANGLDPAGGRVTLMLHTFVGEDEEAVKRLARAPLTDYFKSHIDLIKTMIKSLSIQLEDVDPDDPVWLDYLASFAFERYYQAGSLIGTPAKCMTMVERLKRMGVDEVACFIDFGVDADSVLKSLRHLNELREMSGAASALSDAALRKFLTDRLAEDVGPITLEIRDCLPATYAGQPPRAEPLTHAPHADALRSVDERVRVQKAARQRQHRVKGMGR